MIQQLAKKYPLVDAERVGIFGTSAGGYGAAHAMLVHPEFYKVGVTISGDHDARLDKAWWNELYQGYPVRSDYVEQSNVTMAARLEGHLLIEHGEDRKSTRLNSSHLVISYAVFCLKKKNHNSTPELLSAPRPNETRRHAVAVIVLAQRQGAAASSCDL